MVLFQCGCGPSVLLFIGHVQKLPKILRVVAIVPELLKETTYSKYKKQTLLMEEILHQLVGSLSHCLHGFYTSQLVQNFFHQQHVRIRLVTCFH